MTCIMPHFTQPGHSLSMHLLSRPAGRPAGGQAGREGGGRERWMEFFCENYNIAIGCPCGLQPVL